MQIQIDILMATYNGEKYLEEQLESILSQSYQNFQILIRDDGSIDSTRSVLAEYQKRYPEKICLYFNDGESDGAVNNFSKLMDLSTASHVMFADQDDVWHLEKVETLLSEMTALENRLGKDVPLLVHSDLFVVDEQLDLVSKSFWRYSGLTPMKTHFGRLLHQNVVTGCASMANRKLVEIATPIPNEAIMHDWWLALAASAMGKIRKIGKPTVYYRQHQRNVLGARNFSWKPTNLRQKLKSLKAFLLGVGQLDHIFVPYKKQAETFREKFGDAISPKRSRQLDAFIHLSEQPLLTRKFFIFRYRFFRGKFIQNINIILLS